MLLLLLVDIRRWHILAQRRARLIIITTSMWLQMGFGRRRRLGIVVGDGHRLDNGDVAWVAGPWSPSSLLMGLLNPHGLSRKREGKDGELGGHRGSCQGNENDFQLEDLREGRRVRFGGMGS